MTIDNIAWLTAFDKNFNSSKYLYHYTDIDSAFKILDGNSLKFSKVSRANDTLESKLKIYFGSIHNDTNSKLIEWIQLFNESYSANLQLMCFSMDQGINNMDVDQKTMLTDYSGRGFALPRMWAQYARNNTGVCLVFNKIKLIELINKKLGSLLLHHSKVNYKSQLYMYKFRKDTINQINDSIQLESGSSALNIQCHDFLRNNLDFMRYNYFYKLKDWEGEREYRFLAFSEKEMFVEGSNETLAGVIVGEKFDITHEHILDMLCEDLCELKKITFTISGCKLFNIH